MGRREQRVAWLLAAVTLIPGLARAQAPPLIASWGSYGTGVSQFWTPVGISIDPQGNVYVLDQNNNRVDEFTRDGTYLGQWGTRGGLDGQFGYPRGLTADGYGHLFVADSENERIEEFSSSGAFIRAWGSLGSLPGTFNTPVTIAADAVGDLFVADGNNYRIQEFTNDGGFMTMWTLTSPSFSSPLYADGVTIDSHGYLYICAAGMVLKYTVAGSYVTQWTLSGGGPGHLAIPVRAAVGANGLVYVTDNNNCRIHVFTEDGVFVTSWGTCGTAPGQFSNPIGVAVDGDGNVYVADTNNSRIQKFGPVTGPTPARPMSWGSVKTRYR